MSTGEMFQKKDVEIITNYCDIFLGNDMKIIKDDNPVERKQDGTLSEKDDGYKGWYEKVSKKICERYEVTKKGVKIIEDQAGSETIAHKVSSKMGVQEAKKEVAREVSEDNNASDEACSSGSKKFSDYVIIT